SCYITCYEAKCCWDTGTSICYEPDGCVCTGAYPAIRIGYGESCPYYNNWMSKDAWLWVNYDYGLQITSGNETGTYAECNIGDQTPWDDAHPGSVWESWAECEPIPKICTYPGWI